MFFFHKKNQTLLRRMVAAKFLGFLIGLGGMLFLPSFLSEPLAPMLDWGILIWGISLGAIIGLAGLITECPLWGKSHWFFRSDPYRPLWRGGIVGAWMELGLALLIFPVFQDAFASLDFSPSAFQILLLAAAEGFFWGALIDLLATKYGGEGTKIV